MSILDNHANMSIKHKTHLSLKHKTHMSLKHNKTHMSPKHNKTHLSRKHNKTHLSNQDNKVLLFCRNNKVATPVQPARVCLMGENLEQTFYRARTCLVVIRSLSHFLFLSVSVSLPPSLRPPALSL